MGTAKSIYQALLGVQKAVFSVKKNANNPFFKSKYVDYCSLQREVFPVLNEAGLIVTQPTVVIDGKNYVKTIVTHAESGESIESVTEIIFKPGDAQAQGSGITYARRYGLMALIAIGADDDDANAATGRTTRQQTAPAQTAAPVQQPEEKLYLTAELVQKGKCGKIIKYLSAFDPDSVTDFTKGLKAVEEKYNVTKDGYKALQDAVRCVREQTANA